MNFIELVSANSTNTSSVTLYSLTKYKAVVIAFLSVFFLSSLLLLEAKGTTSRCRPCEDIQHATDLLSIEQHFLEANNDSFQALDKKARKWYAKFQKGGFFVDGWQKISKNVVEKVPEQTKVKTEFSMLALGVKIGCEWSKDNDIRKISTAMLRGWGKQLRKTISNSPAQLPMLLSSIEYEVDTLLF